MTILVVEDHCIVREPLTRLLRLEGYQTLSAGNGNEAVAILNEAKVDLVLLDLVMPKKDGIGFLEIARADPRWKTLPVIVLSGLIEGSQVDRARELSGNELLFKAKFDMDELLARIRQFAPGETNSADRNVGDTTNLHETARIFTTG